VNKHNHIITVILILDYIIVLYIHILCMKHSVFFFRLRSALIDIKYVMLIYSVPRMIFDYYFDCTELLI